MSTQPHHPQGFTQQVLGDTTGLHNHDDVVEGALSKLVKDINELIKNITMPKEKGKKKKLDALRRHLVCTLRYFRLGHLCPLTSSDFLRIPGVTVDDICDFFRKNPNAFLLDKTRKFQEEVTNRFIASRRRDASTPPPPVNWNGSVW